MVEKIGYSTHKLKLSTLMTIMISISVTAAALIAAVPFASIYTSAVKSNAEIALEQSVSQTERTVEMFTENMEKRLSNLCDELAGSNDPAEIQEKLSVAARLEDSIEAICVYDSSGELLVCGSKRSDLKNSGVNLSYDKELFENSDGFAFSIPHVQTLFEEYYPWVVTIVHREPKLLDGKDVFIAIDFSFIDIAGYVDSIGIGTHGYCYITDFNGEPIYHPRQQMLYSGVAHEELHDISSRKDGTYVEGNIIRTISTLEGTDWRIVGVSYLDEMNSMRDKALSGVLLATLICCLILGIIIRAVLAKILTRPVNSLIASMHSFESSPDDYRYSPAENQINELQMISDSFGQMTWIIRSLMEKAREEEATLRKTELKALQAQINPHFLYNTLDSIQWMCERGKNESAVNMVSALAKLFRISISRGHELIPIRDELKHAESYLIIQKYRYSDRFEYRFDIDESLNEYLCSKITLQPLIENAIYHGIEPLIDDGEIVISAYSEGEDIILSVADNGVGMTAEQVNSVLSKNRSDSNGIGVRNVNDRIKIYFGECYGLSVESEPDEGTTIKVRIPRVTNENDLEK